MTNAANANVLTDELSRPIALQSANIEIMTTERIMETDIPVMNANAHMMHITISSRSHRTLRRFKNNGNSKQRNEYMIPTCSPETASR
jgi:hypothetical protein